MPSNESGIGKFSGYESVVFTADGGFVAGGFANGQHDSIDTLHYKSGGQVDSGNPIAQKFSASVANTGKQSSPLSATPEWTFACGGQGSTNCSKMVGSFNTMRVFTENGVEKIASTFRLPKSAIITLNASNGTEDRFVKRYRPEVSGHVRRCHKLVQQYHHRVKLLKGILSLFPGKLK